MSEVEAKIRSRRRLAVLIYAVTLGALATISAAALTDLRSRTRSAAAAQAMLDQLERRGAAHPTADAVAMSGSPLLEGPTLTVAGAALQQRVSSAVKKVGGEVVSTQVELDGPHASEGFITLSTNVLIEQGAIQSLLYDIEAGMPYLFVDALSIQSPQAIGDTANARMRVELDVSGKWAPAK